MTKAHNEITTNSTIIKKKTKNIKRKDDSNY